MLNVEPEVGAAFVATMRVVQLAGGEVVPVSLPELEQLRVAHLATISSEMRVSMKPYTKVRTRMLAVATRLSGAASRQASVLGTTALVLAAKPVASLFSPHWPA